MWSNYNIIDIFMKRNITFFVLLISLFSCDFKEEQFKEAYVCDCQQDSIVRQKVIEDLARNSYPPKAERRARHRLTEHYTQEICPLKQGRFLVHSNAVSPHSYYQFSSDSCGSAQIKEEYSSNTIKMN